MSLLMWLILAAAVKHVWLVLTLLLPAAIILPLEVWGRVSLGAPSSAQSVALVFETTAAEAANFLLTYGTALLLSWGGWLAFYFCTLYLSWRSRLSWSHRSRLPFLVTALFALFLFHSSSSASHWLKVQQETDPLGGLKFSGWSQQWADVYPVNLAIASQEYVLQKDKIEEIRGALERQIVDSRILDPLVAADVVVLVIGESSTATHWGLLGYERKTTPALQSRAHIIAFSDAVGLSVATRAAVPGVLSRAPVLTPAGKVNSAAQPSLVRAFSQAGYRTHWLSNQAPFGKHDTAISVYAGEADEVRFLNPSTYRYRGSYDEVLLLPLRDILQEPGRHFIVLHTLGSHFNYAMRYPQEHDYFGVDDGNEDARSFEQKRLDAYDNSIRYTDYILDNVIKLLEVRNDSSMLMYFSDHGVDPPQGKCALGVTERGSEDAYHVPVVVWASDVMRGRKPRQWDTLVKHKDMPYTMRALMPALYALSGITVRYKDEVDQNREYVESFLSAPDLQARPRMVAFGDKMIDFDLAREKNACRISAQ
tara:strand:- start:58965 stop:60572 length:1608 start_codon:yes stop_codon:yes gene_type:complete